MIKDFFYLQKNDQQAILVLLGVILICSSLVFLIGNSNNESNDITNKDSSIMNPKTPSNKKTLYYKVEGKVHELFVFDPNTADSTTLLRLGLQPWQVRSIYRYRAKGGIYRQPSDFAKLFGLTKKQYETLVPFIKIADDYRPASDFYGKRGYSSIQQKYQKDTYLPKENNMTENTTSPQETKLYNYPHKLKLGQQVQINTADTTELMKIPGIGNYYAKQIVRYRERLGGFVSAEQLREIENFPESAFPYIHINPQAIKKWNINQLNLQQLRRHPYINFYQAKAICDYRRLRGPLKNLDELKLLKDFPPEEIKRLQPYIQF